MDTLNETIKHELEFCEEIKCEKNDCGQYLYLSENKSSSFSLPFLLLEYKQWLIEHKIIEIK